jgi:hypothetical protein
MKELLGMSSLKEGAVRAVGERQPQEINSRVLQVGTSSEQGKAIPVRLFGANSLEKGAM